jgi:hypothetical protein
LLLAAEQIAAREGCEIGAVLVDRGGEGLEAAPELAEGVEPREPLGRDLDVAVGVERELDVGELFRELDSPGTTSGDTKSE